MAFACICSAPPQPDFPGLSPADDLGQRSGRQRASGGRPSDGYTSADAANARKFLTHLHAVDPLRVISDVTSMPHEAYLSTLAPADEYFGRMGFSILGIENQLKHINFMLDYNYGNRESGETVLVAESIDDMHKVYPRDRDLPMLLYWCYTTLGRMDNAESQGGRQTPARHPHRRISGQPGSQEIFLPRT